MKSCKFCNNPAPNNLQGYCQACYKYFIIDKKETYDLPEQGKITYAPNGDCICPFCGKAFRKLGMHFYYSHGLTSKLAHELAGWDYSAKATNPQYRELMRNKLMKKCVDINLLKCGENTRFKKNSKGRTKDKIQTMTLIRLKQSFIRRKKSGNDCLKNIRCKEKENERSY